jgi:hypothetical protein
MNTGRKAFSETEHHRDRQHLNWRNIGCVCYQGDVLL